MHKYKVEVVRVVDGDTVVLKVDLGFRMRFVDHFRLVGINTPEMNTNEGVVAKEALMALLDGVDRVEIVSSKRGKYRWLAELFVWENEEDTYPINVNDWLVEKGYALPYY